MSTSTTTPVNHTRAEALAAAESVEAGARGTWAAATLAVELDAQRLGLRDWETAENSRSLEATATAAWVALCDARDATDAC